MNTPPVDGHLDRSNLTPSPLVRRLQYNEVTSQDVINYRRQKHDRLQKDSPAAKSVDQQHAHHRKLRLRTQYSYSSITTSCKMGPTAAQKK